MQIIVLTVLCSCVGGILVSVLTSSVVDHEIEYWCGQTKDNEIGIWCFSAKQAALMRKSKRLVCLELGGCFKVEWYVFPRTVLSVSWHYKIRTKCVALVQRGHHHHLIDYNLFSDSWQNCDFRTAQQLLIYSLRRNFLSQISIWFMDIKSLCKLLSYPRLSAACKIFTDTEGFYQVPLIINYTD